MQGPSGLAGSLQEAVPEHGHRGGVAWTMKKQSRVRDTG